MVGRLVEQQQVGLLQQQFGQGEAHLPAAGEFFGLAVPVLLYKSQPGKNGADLGLDGIAVAGLKFMLDDVGSDRRSGAYSSEA